MNTVRLKTIHFQRTNHYFFLNDNISLSLFFSLRILSFKTATAGDNEQEMMIGGVSLSLSLPHPPYLKKKINFTNECLIHVIPTRYFLGFFFYFAVIFFSNESSTTGSNSTLITDPLTISPQ